MITKEQARKLRSFLEQMSENATDEQALDNILAFPKWEVGKEYVKDDRVRYEDVLYKVIQNHTSQAQYTPDIAISLYVKVHQQDPGDEYPDWVQPTGAHDAYEYGEKCSHLLKEDGTKRHWISIFEGLNVWCPGDPGTESLWQEVE